jgi:uncharacterized protein (TIGR04141 family)
VPPRTSCKPLNVYRLEGGRDLAEYLLSESDGVEYNDRVVVADTECRLIVGTRQTERPVWAPHLETLTGYSVDTAGYQPYAVLLVPVDGWTFALTFGSGHHLVDDELVDQGFGLMFGIRRLDADQLGSIASAALDVSARSTVTSFPGGSDLGGFRLEPYGEVVNRVTGSASLQGLTYEQETHRHHQIRAGNSLFLPLPSGPEALLKDLRALTSVVDETDEHSALRFVAQMRPLDKYHRLRPELEARLAAALGGDPDAGLLGLAWPAASTRDIEVAGSFRVTSLGTGGPIVFAPGDDVTALTGRFAGIDETRRMKVLRNARVSVCLDTAGVEEEGKPISLRKWFAFETTVGHAHYCYQQGEWYRIGEGFVDQIRSQVADLLARRSDLNFPVWVPTGKRDDEHLYCELVAKQPGYLCLDKSFARTPFHPKFELCDVVGPGNELVHIKWLGRATAASHLYTQATVSAEALRDEPEALQQLDGKIRALDPARTQTDPSSVVLAIAGRGWTVDRLFTLSQVALLRLDRVMRHLRTDLTFAEIPFTSKAEAKRFRDAA